jgi:hypothetical protein
MVQHKGDALARFAYEENLDHSILQGQPYANSGGRDGFSKDPYSIEAGLLGNWEEIPRISHCITGIWLTSSKRFANSLLQLTHACMVGRSLGVKRLHIPGFWYLREGIHYSSNGLEIRNTDQVDLSADQLILAGSFLKMKALKPLCRRRVNPRRMLRSLRPLINLDINATADKKEDLVIHIRSGDIFITPHPGYGQPPLAFYQKVVRSKPWNTVRVIFEDRLNPVITPLLDWLPHHCKQVEVVSGSLKDDLEVLLRARTIACGRGTFIQGISALSRNLKKVYHWNDATFKTWGNRKLKVFRVVDGMGTYSKMICQANWQNTADQQQLMVTYPEEGLRIQRPLPNP